MKHFGMLIKREWLEWQRIIIWTVAITTFLSLLALFTMNRGSNHIQRELEKNGHLHIEEFVVEDDDEGERSFSFDIQVDGDEVNIQAREHFESDDYEETTESSEDPTGLPTIGMAYFLGFSFHALHFLVLFLALFYFADSFYKERADNSTLFYRSLPISDNMIVSSKLVSGLLGIMLLTLLLSLELLIVARMGMGLLGKPLSTFVVGYWSDIQIAGLIYDWIVFLIVSSTRLLPLVLFLMLVSAWVKGRPLIIGIGGPILLGITVAILFGSPAVFTTMFELFVNITRMTTEQWLVADSYAGGPLEIYGSFWGYLFTWDTLLILIISAGLYYGNLWLYRKNIPTG